MNRSSIVKAALGPVLLGVTCVLVALAGPIASADAEFRITRFDGAVLNADGSQADQAGSHPFSATTSFELGTKADPAGFLGTSPDGQMRDVHVDLPPGFIGNPTVTPQCPAEIAQLDGQCPVSTQVGTATLRLTYGGNPYSSPTSTFPYPLYNVEPPPGSPALFTFRADSTTISLVPELRFDGNYALSVVSAETSQAILAIGASVTLWGVPADRSHDGARGVCLGTDDDGDGDRANDDQCPSDLQPRAFLTNPMDCATGPLTTRLRVNSWETPDVFATASFDHDTAGRPFLVNGCDRVPFDGDASLSIDQRQGDTPTALSGRLHFPDGGLLNPPSRANGYLRDLSITMPEGLTINPASAGGLAACSDAQLGLGSMTPTSCPDGSKLGEATAKTPLLDREVAGELYLRPQNSDDPESGEMFRVALVLRNAARGILVKLPGSIVADKDTGRLTATFKNNPQLPVSDLAFALKSGSRAPLATPADCGQKSIIASLTSWAGEAFDRPSSFGIDCAPGLGAFAPSFDAGTSKAQGGAFAPFTLNLSKPDGNSAVNGLSLSLPTGLLARLKGNLGQQIGTVTAYAGPGSSPYPLPGRVYLEGRYDDAPFSLRVVVPAKAGPFDLGDVTVRQKIYVDPIDAHVTVISDPLPTIVKGVPVRLQRLDVNVDKAGFTLNPTSCAPKTIAGALAAPTGQTAPIGVRFQASSCATLALKPSLALSLSGKGQTTDGKHPAVTADLTQPFGAQANLKKVRVALPLSLALDPDNANGLCEFVDGSKVEPTCPKASIVGSATASTPILDEPLSGPVYFVKNIRKDAKSGREIRTLPKLVIPLVGQNGVKLTLTGTSDVVADQLVSTFDNIPDAPVSSFKLNINGGKGGILTVSGADICKATQIADQQVDGQNNKQADADVYIQTPSCPTKIISKKVTAKAVVLKVGGLGAGKVTITGKGIKKANKTIAKSTVATITARRTKGKPGKVTVSFDPTGPAKARKTTR